MYENVKYLGKTLKEWRDEVFHGTFNLGELYKMVKSGKDLSRISPMPNECTSSRVNMPKNGKHGRQR